MTTPPGRITSPQNQRVKTVARLHTRRERDATGRFLIEGSREVERAIAAGVSIETIYLRVGDGDDTRHADVPGGVEVVEMAPEPYRRIAYRDVAGGRIAVARQFGTALPALAPDAFVLVAEAVEKPGNLGAMVRSAAAAGVDAVVLCDSATDVFNPNVVRASLGTVFDVAIGVAGGEEVRAWLAAHRVAWHATSAHGTLPYWDADLTGACAVVVGSEDRGLSEGWLGDRSSVLTIPLAGGATSLNAAIAAALLLYEGVRQRTGR